jgi:hypothetical protein
MELKKFMDKRKDIVLFAFDILDMYNMDSFAIALRPRKKAAESSYHVEIGKDDVVFL